MKDIVDRRAELLGLVVEDLLKVGAANLSLRPLAERVGTSARLLIYHFVSKDQLLATALDEVRRRVGASLRARALDVRPLALRDLVMMIWDWATEPASQCYFRLLFEVDGLAMFDRVSFSREARRANSDVWIALIENAAGRLEHGGDLFAAHSILIVGAISGLLQEFLSTGDRIGTTRALSTLVDLISLSASAPIPSQGQVQ